MPLPSLTLWVLSLWVTSWPMSGRAQEALAASAAEQAHAGAAEHDANASPVAPVAPVAPVLPTPPLHPEVERAEPESQQREHAEPEGYAWAVDAAVLAHSEGRFEESKAELEKAHAIFPNARTLRGLGKLAFELGDYPAAVEHFEAALRSHARPLDERLREEVEALLQRARASVGELLLWIEPEDATVWVDEVVVSSGAGAARILRVGSHLIEVRRDGFEPALRRFEVRSGETTELRLALTQVAEPTPQARPSAPAAKRPSRTRWARWLSVGLATAAAVGAAVVVGVASGESSIERKVEGGTSGVVLRNQ